jgi:hypothetical protein
MEKLPEKCYFLPGIAKQLKCGYSTLRRLQKKPGFPSPIGSAVSENKRSADYYNIEEVKSFKAKCNQAGRLLPADKTKIVVVSRSVTDKFFSQRLYKQTRLSSGKVVKRRVVVAPDHWGLLA